MMLNLVKPSSMAFDLVLDYAISRGVVPVKPQTPQRSTAPATQPTAPTVPSKGVKHASVPYLPPGAPARDVAWLNIVIAAGSTDPVAIDDFLQTPAGQSLYTKYLEAIK